ncbi:hypothetical protein HYPSUDRAFT_200708 [Hypholoma sublateritium FD-334 SS-4]|uniref:Uncharacterized protein n=1 Tax=Hypholoma sublateritium (strain FD-334 SS-4) TaxID=945553 RepID=A0A0D2MKI2_HYPSF|nr:hypothetical protein HYPSUDRAFT_200708 [Hypholoma sublateritium FD-334 SS-4]
MRPKPSLALGNIRTRANVLTSAGVHKDLSKRAWMQRVALTTRLEGTRRDESRPSHRALHHRPPRRSSVATPPCSILPLTAPDLCALGISQSYGGSDLALTHHLALLCRRRFLYPASRMVTAASTASTRPTAVPLPSTASSALDVEFASLLRHGC